MAHYARVENGVVTEVIVAESNFINSGAVGNPSQWYKTSYNTRGGQYIGENPFGLKPYRKNFAGVGYTYDAQRDAFIPPKPVEGNWVLNEETCLWDPVGE